MRSSTLFAFFFPSLSPPSTHCLRQSGDVVGVNMKGVRFMMGGGKRRRVGLGFLWGEGGRALVGGRGALGLIWKCVSARIGTSDVQLLLLFS